MSAAHKLRTTAITSSEEYLAFERNAEFKHEYFDGQIYAMAGTSSRHNRIAGKTYAALDRMLDGSRCVPYFADIRTKIESGYTYPDIVIACNPTFEDDELETLTNPVIIIEVLSASTENYDRTKKFDRYRSIPTLREYVLIAQAQPRIERFSRIDNPNVPPERTLWAFEAWTGLEGTITMEAIACTLTVAEIYRGIEFDEMESENTPSMHGASQKNP